MRMLTLLIAGLATSACTAQQTEFVLDDTGGWVEDRAPEPGSDEAVIAEARRLLATDKPKAARKLLSPWIREHERTDNAWLPEAYLLRGDAKTAAGDEYDALFDYELVIQQFFGSEAYPEAIEREFEIAKLYAAGLNRKVFGLRIEPVRSLGEELLVRVQERMPSSELAERAAMALADHYYDRREMPLAAEMYGIFVENFPDSPRAKDARMRQILASVAGFKGPEYDGSGLIEAQTLIERYRRRYPADAAAGGVVDGLETRIDESAARQMLERAKWYLARKDEPSARFTLRRLLRKHPRSTAALVAAETMVERGWIETPAVAPPEPAPAENAGGDERR